MFDLFSECSAGWNVLLFSLLEVILVAWLYGVDNFLNNIKEMGINLPRPMLLYWKICWKFITPTLLFVVLIISFVDYRKLETTLYKTATGREVSYVWPRGIQGLAWLMPLGTFIFIPLLAIYQIWKLMSSGKPITGWTLVNPTSNWKPSPDSMRVIGTDTLVRQLSRRASRQSFRKYLPQNSEALI